MTIYYFFNFLNKKLKKGILFSKGGRNLKGRICVRSRGNGKKILYRFIDFYRRLNLKGRVLSSLYDPNRTGRLGLVLYINGLSSYILLQKNVFLNDIIYSGSILCEEKIKEGFSLPLKYMPLYSNISNIELKPFKGSTLCRASDTSCILIGKTEKKGILKLNSKWELHLSLNCISSFGTITYRLFNNWLIKKAGKNRAFGFRPKVRGVAMNPCDHPHGGGSGKKGKPKIPVSPLHSVFKWRPTTNRKKDNLKRRKFKNLHAN